LSSGEVALEVDGVFAEELFEFFAGVNSFFDQEGVHCVDGGAEGFVAADQFEGVVEFN
jgi:hypothetical protein